MHFYFSIIQHFAIFIKQYTAKTTKMLVWGFFAIDKTLIIEGIVIKLILIILASIVTIIINLM